MPQMVVPPIELQLPHSERVIRTPTAEHQKSMTYLLAYFRFFFTKGAFIL